MYFTKRGLIQRFSGRSVLFRYLTNYIGVAVAACAIIGTMMFSSATNELIYETRKAEKGRLSMACEDFASCLATMDNIALLVSTTKEYQPFYLEQSSYNRITTLDSFQRYSNFTPIIDQYYLFYPDMDTVYTPKAEYQFYLFAHNVMSLDDETARRVIMSSKDMFVVPDQPEIVYMSYPIAFRYTSTHSFAYLMFRLDMHSLINRYTTMFKLSDNMQIIMGDQVLFSAELGQDYIESTIELDQGNLTFRMRPSDYSKMSFFKAGTLISFFVITLIISAISALIAWRSYLPIHRLANKLNLNHDTEQNEIKLIEEMIKILCEEKRFTMDQLTDSLGKVMELTAFLRQQLILELLTGNQKPGWETHINHCSIMLYKPFLCVVYISWQVDTDQDAVLTYLESSATLDVSLYGVILPNNAGIAAIVGANEDEELADYCRLLPNRIMDEGFNVSIRQGKVVNQLDSISESFYSAREEQKEKPDSEINAIYDPQDLEDLKQALIEGNRENAISVLDGIIEEIIAHCSSMLIKRYCFIQLTYQVVSAGRRLNVFLPDVIVQQVVLAENDNVLCDNLRVLLNRILVEHNPAPSKFQSEKYQKVVNFISESAFDYTMCLDLVATEFGISTKQVSRIVKQATGGTFKDYLLRLRMEMAIKLLQDGMPPSEVTERIGYVDERYFKKRFYEYTDESAMRIYMRRDTAT